jgi:hypothetical protein
MSSDIAAFANNCCIELFKKHFTEDIDWSHHERYYPYAISDEALFILAKMYKVLYIELKHDIVKFGPSIKEEIIRLKEEIARLENIVNVSVKMQ